MADGRLVSQGLTVEQDPSCFGWRVYATVVLIACVVSVLGWPARMYGTDPLVYREEGRAILSGRLHTDAPPAGRLSRPGDYFVQNPRNGLWYSKYGVFNSVASLPPLVAERVVTGSLPAFESRSRVTFLNAYNTLLTMGLGVLLVRVAGLYVGGTKQAAGAGGTGGAWVVGAFAVACLFGTFLWNYTRAQSTEIVQVMLMLGAWEGFVRYVRGRRVGGLGVMWVCLGAMVLTRVYFVTLLPVAAVAVMWKGEWGWRGLMRGAVPVMMIGVVVAGVQWVKFGSVWSTGYHAFEAGRHLPTWDPRPGLWGFLVSPQKAAWWHFAPLLLAVGGWPGFLRRHRFEGAVMLVGAAVYVLPLCTIPSWAGEWSFGPRYLLFGLPLVSLPVVGWVTTWGGWPGWRRRVVGVVAVASLFVGAYLSWQVNRLDFFAAHELRSPLRRAAGVVRTATAFADDDADYPGRGYWSSRPLGLIVRDLIAAEGEVERMPLWPEVRDRLTGPQQEELKRAARSIYRRPGWYWSEEGGQASNQTPR